MLVAQLCPTLCDPVDCSLPVSSVHGILQARKLEWVAIPFSRGSFWPRDWTLVSCIGRWILYHLGHQGSPYLCSISWNLWMKKRSLYIYLRILSWRCKEILCYADALNPMIWILIRDVLRGGGHVIAETNIDMMWLQIKEYEPPIETEREAKREFPLYALRECSPANTFISHFWLPQLRENKFVVTWRLSCSNLL